jgi:hypothetical protein
MLNRPLKTAIICKLSFFCLLILFSSCRKRSFGPKSDYQSSLGVHFTSKDSSLSIVMEKGQMNFGFSCDAAFTPLLPANLISEIKKRNRFDELETNLANQTEVLKDLEKYLPANTKPTILEALRQKITKQIFTDEQSLLFANQVLQEADATIRSLAVPYCFKETRAKLLADQKLPKLEVFDTLISMLEQAGVPKNALTVAEQLKEKSDLVDLRSLPPSIEESFDSQSTLKAILSKYDYELELKFTKKVTLPVDSPLVFQNGSQLIDEEPRLNENACLFWVASSKSYSKCRNYAENRVMGSFASQSVLFDDPTKMVVNSSYLELFSEDKNLGAVKGCASLVCGVISKKHKKFAPIKAVVDFVGSYDSIAYENLDWWISKNERKTDSLRIFDLKEILPQDVLVTFKRNKH